MGLHKWTLLHFQLSLFKIERPSAHPKNTESTWQSPKQSFWINFQSFFVFEPDPNPALFRKMLALFCKYAFICENFEQNYLNWKKSPSSWRNSQNPLQIIQPNLKNGQEGEGQPISETKGKTYFCEVFFGSFCKFILLEMKMRKSIKRQTTTFHSHHPNGKPVAIKIN